MTSRQRESPDTLGWEIQARLWHQCGPRPFLVSASTLVNGNSKNLRGLQQAAGQVLAPQPLKGSSGIAHRPLPPPGSESCPSAVSLCDLQQVTKPLWTPFLQQQNGDNKRIVTYPCLPYNVLVANYFYYPGTPSHLG